MYIFRNSIGKSKLINEYVRCHFGCSPDPTSWSSLSFLGAGMQNPGGTLPHAWGVPGDDAIALGAQMQNIILAYTVERNAEAPENIIHSIRFESQ